MLEYTMYMYWINIRRPTTNTLQADFPFDACYYRFSFLFLFVQQFQKVFSSLLSVEVFAAWSAHKLTLVKLHKKSLTSPEASNRQLMEDNPTLRTGQEGRQHSSADDPGKQDQVEELAYVLHTSGTTGLPKIVKVPHKCIVPNIVHLRWVYNIYYKSRVLTVLACCLFCTWSILIVHCINSWVCGVIINCVNYVLFSSLFQMTAEDIVFLASPLTFDPSVVEMFLALSSGACLLMVPSAVRRMPSRLANVLFRRNITTILQVNVSKECFSELLMLERSLMEKK